MKFSKIFHLLIFVLLILTGTLLAQDLFIHEMIGGSREDILKKFGKPVHQDDSIPSMICMFYKTDSYSMTFVLNKEGIFQAEESINYSNMKEALNAVNEIISGSEKKNFAVDTVSSTAFRLNKKGISANLQIFPDQISKKYLVSLKAKKY